MWKISEEVKDQAAKKVVTGMIVHRVTAGVAIVAVAFASSLSAEELNATQPRIAVDHVSVKPVFYVASDAAPPSLFYANLLSKHLKWCQERYSELLGETFDLVQGPALVLRSKHNAEYLKKSPEGGAPDAVVELFEHDKVNRFTCPFIYLVLFVGTGTTPAGGGRAINGFVNTGGGIVILAADNLDRSANFQSTLQHELGHAFGLVHVSSYKYSMETNDSIMSHNPAHHTKGLEPSKTPGRFIPEDFRLLTLNKRVFSNLQIDVKKVTPANYTMFPTIVMIPAMKLPGQADYTGPWNGIYK